jgi:hypothetical protein
MSSETSLIAKTIDPTTVRFNELSLDLPKWETVTGWSLDL